MAQMRNKMPLKIDFTLPPTKALAHLASKKPQISQSALKNAAYNRVFTIKGIANVDLLSSLQQSLSESLAKGENFSVWRDKAQSLLSQHGEILSPKRIEQIYHQNILSSYAMGRKMAQDSLTGEIYLRYVAINDARTRANHRLFHGIILPKDHEFWSKHYPGMDFGCRCRADAYTKAQLDRKGLKISMSEEQLKAYRANPPKAQNDELQDLRRIIDSKLLAHAKNPDASKALRKILQELEERHSRFREVERLWNTKDLSQTATLAKTPPHIQKIFNTQAKHIQLKASVVQDHIKRHPEIDAFDYSLIGDMIENIDSIYQDEKSNVKYILLNKLGKWYRLSLKSLSDKKEIWVESLLRVDEKEILLKNLKNKKVIYAKA